MDPATKIFVGTAIAALLVALVVAVVQLVIDIAGGLPPRFK